MRSLLRIASTLVLLLAVGGNAAVPALAGQAPADPLCSLLSSPVAEALSAAGETALRARCGLLATDAPPVAPDISPAAPLVGADVLVNDRSGDSYSHVTQSETSIAVFGQNVVIGWNDSSLYPAENKFTGYGYSADGGVSFTDGGAPPTTGAAANGHWGDPVIGVDTSGDFYFSTLADDASNKSVIAVFKSTNGGQTWNTPVNGTPGVASSHFQDKEEMALDTWAASPYKDRIYLCNTDFGNFSDAIKFYRSTNGGASFKFMAAVVSKSYASGYVQGCHIAVAPSGKVFVAWLDIPNSGKPSIKVRRSDDSGKTWKATKTIATVNPVGSYVNCRGGSRRTLNGNIRVMPFPSLAVHNDGEIYATWSGNKNPDVYFSKSANNGNTWSAKTKVNDDGTATDQWQPRIAVNSDGDISILFLNRREDTVNNMAFRAYQATSTDGGTIWTNGAIGDVTSPVPTLNPNFDTNVAACYMGDYHAIVGVGSEFYMSWSDNRLLTGPGGNKPDPDIYFDK